METFDPAELPELLKLYYRRLFPYAQYYRWLNYGGGDGGGEWGGQWVRRVMGRGPGRAPWNRSRLWAGLLRASSRAFPTTSRCNGGEGM